MRHRFPMVVSTLCASVIVATASLAPPAAQAATTQAAWQVQRIGGDLLRSPIAGGAAGVSADGRYVVTSESTLNDDNLQGWNDIETGTQRTFSIAGNLDYLPGQSPSLAQSVPFVANNYAADNSQSTVDFATGSVTALGPSWYARLKKDSLRNPDCPYGDNPEILSSNDEGVLVRLYGCFRSALTGGSGNVDLFLWHPQSGSLEFVSPAPSPLSPLLAFAGMGSMTADTRYFLYQARTENPANPGTYPYLTRWHLYDRTSGTITPLPATGGDALASFVPTPTGPQVSLRDSDGSQYRYDIATGVTSAPSLPAMPDGVPAYADQRVDGIYSANGRFLLANVYSGSQACCAVNVSVVLFDLLAGKSQLVLADSGGAVVGIQEPAFVSDDGRRVIYSSGTPLTGTRRGTFLFTPAVPSDTTPPTVTGTPDRPANPAGWWSGPVTVHWTATDPDNPTSELTTAPDTVVTADGGNQQVTSNPVCDQAGNCATGTTSVSVDSTGPAVTISGVTEGTKYPLATPATPACAATDALSGVVGSCTLTMTGANSNGVGAITATARATDLAGNTSTTTVHYKVVYGWNGFNQPINDTAHQTGQATSVFKAGSTIPAQFTLTDAAGHAITPLTAPTWLTPVRGAATTAPVDESVYTDPADSGSTYRLTGSQWKYNWKTDSTQAGYYWRIGVRLDDGETYYVNIALR